MAREMSPEETVLFYAIVVAITLFFGMFFGVLYPELPKSNFILSSCLPTNTTILSRYCCTKVCSSCDTAFGAPQCGFVLSQMEATPTTVMVNSRICHDGYRCCSTQCDPCSSCNSKKGCNTYSCNCRCNAYTDAVRCEARCDICYTASVTFSHSAGTGVYNEDFGLNLAKAQAKIAQYSFNKAVTCYYPPDDPSAVVFNKEYHVPAIALTTVFGILPLYLVLWFATVYITGAIKWPSVFWGSFVPFLVFIGVWTATKTQAYFILACVSLAPLAGAIVHSLLVRVPKAEEVIRAEALPDLPVAEAEPVVTATATDVLAKV